MTDTKRLLVPLVIVGLSLSYVYGNSPKATVMCPDEMSMRESPQTRLADSLKADSLLILCNVLCNSGDYDEALRIGTVAVEYCRQIYGTNHIDYATSLGNLASYNYAIGNYAEAIRLGTEALEIQGRVIGTEHMNYLTSLDYLEFYNSTIGNYSEAIRLCTEALEIRGRVVGTEDTDYARSLNNLASYNYAIGNYSEAIRLGTEALEIRRRVLGTEHPAYATSLNNLAGYNSVIGNYAEAIRLGTEALEITGRVVGTKHPDYATSLSNLACYNNDMGNYAEAIRLGTEALEIRRRVLGTEHPAYATSLNNLAGYNSVIGNYAEAIRLGTEALEITGRVVGTEHPDYATSLDNLAGYNSDIGNFAEAIRLGTEALEIRRRVLGTEHPDYAMSLNKLAGYNYAIGNYAEAIRLGTEALEVLGTEHPDYARYLNNLATYNSSIGNYAEAIHLGTEALEIHEKVLGTEHPDYATSLSNLAGYNSDIGNFAEAIRLCTEALEIRRRVLGTEHPDYARSLSNLAYYNSDIGNYAEAIRLCMEAMEIQGKLLGTAHPDYAISLNNLATYNSSIGNYAEAIQLETEALEIQGRVIGTAHPDYATSLDNLAGYNSDIGNFAEAIRLGTEALEIRRRVLGTEHKDYAMSLNDLAGYNSDIGNYAEAIRLGTEALEIQKSVLGTEYPDYARYLNNLATYNSSIGNYAEAIQLETEALEIQKRVLGTEHPDYAWYLNNLAIHYYMDGRDKTKQYYYTTESTNTFTRIISTTFADLSSKERSLFWDKYKYWFEEWVHTFSYEDPCDPLSANGYNSVLLGKGLLLNSDIEFSKLIEESGDTAMERVYTDLRSVRAQITKTEEKYRSADSLQFIALRHKVDSLNKIAESKEKTLLGSCKVYGDYTKNLVITWEQVREKLGDDDVAIEFVSFPWNADSTMYIAYALRRDYECPQLITLFEESQLTGVGKGDIYTTDTISSLVWKPLREVTEGASNVYFSPGGELYNIAIESVPTYEDGGKTPMCDYDAGRMFHRLSSTRELALIREENTWDYAAVYGGLEYGMSDVALIADREKYPARRDLAIIPDVAYNIADTLRESLSLPHYLEGTAQEAIAISDNLTRADIATKLLMDTLGTEASFKDLSGRRTSILHIGTHGFFNKEKKRNTDERQAPPAYDNMARHISEDKAMTRSGLLFAGANYALAGNRLPDNVDDGILTAKELTAVDLRGLDIVVLSACQTGLGQITGDGVFGLQRGFKKAGAQTIVMSLWKVDDKATRLFMDRFFENLANNGIHKKRQSFIEAQRYLRHEYQENGSHIYSSPEYWAAFIMLDGE